VAREVREIEQKRSGTIFFSLDRRYVSLTRANYYWKMFGVNAEKIFLIPENMPTDAIFHQIQIAAKKKNINNIVLFSLVRVKHKDILELCDQHFRREEEKVFTTRESAPFHSW